MVALLNYPGALKLYQAECSFSHILSAQSLLAAP